jgi:hypothetical protein
VKRKRSKKEKYRDRLARKLLLSELQLSKSYRREVNNPAVDIKPEELEYKRRVVAAAEKAKTYCRNFPDCELRIKYYDMLVSGDSVVKTYTACMISESTYYEWRNAILDKFGQGIGIWL